MDQIGLAGRAELSTAVFARVPQQPEAKLGAGGSAAAPSPQNRSQCIW